MLVAKRSFEDWSIVILGGIHIWYRQNQRRTCEVGIRKRIRTVVEFPVWAATTQPYRFTAPRTSDDHDFIPSTTGQTSKRDPSQPALKESNLWVWLDSGRVCLSHLSKVSQCSGLVITSRNVDRDAPLHLLIPHESYPSWLSMALEAVPSGFLHHWREALAVSQRCGWFCCTRIGFDMGCWMLTCRLLISAFLNQLK